MCTLHTWKMKSQRNQIGMTRIQFFTQAVRSNRWWLTAHCSTYIYCTSPRDHLTSKAQRRESILFSRKARAGSQQVRRRGLHALHFPSGILKLNLLVERALRRRDPNYVHSALRRRAARFLVKWIIYRVLHGGIFVIHEVRERDDFLILYFAANYIWIKRTYCWIIISRFNWIKGLRSSQLK